MSFKTRLFFILLTAGLAGVFSFLLIDLSALVALLPGGRLLDPSERRRAALLALRG